jgi:hypothetical protein
LTLRQAQISFIISSPAPARIRAGASSRPAATTRRGSFYRKKDKIEKAAIALFFPPFLLYKHKMPRLVLLTFLLASFLATPLRAVYTIGAPNNGYDTTQPTTNSNIPNWITIGNTTATGWGGPGVTGWDYVGQIGPASGVYLGDGWVLTAGHVGMGNFTLDGTTYLPVVGSGVSISDAYGTADLTFFKIQTSPDLPDLIISDDLPVVFSPTETGSSVVMLGFGGGNGHLTWGLDTVTDKGYTFPDGYNYVSQAFFTDNYPITYGTTTVDNQSTLVGGDSGGADFTFDDANQKWELAGINEVVAADGSFSGYVQLDDYLPQIELLPGIVIAPEPQTWALFGLGLAFVWGYSRRRSSVRRRE